MIEAKWGKGESSFHDSQCGRFEIHHIYRSTVRPSGYKLKDMKLKKEHWVDRVKDGKELANRILQDELNPPKMLSDEEAAKLF